MDSSLPPQTQFRTNTELLEGLQDAERQTVWNDFVGRYRPTIVGYVAQLGFRRDDAEDIAQASLLAFSTAFRDGKFERSKGRLRSWMFGIVLNHVRSARRKKSVREVQVADNTANTGFFENIEADDQMEKLWEEQWHKSVLKQCFDQIRLEIPADVYRAFHAAVVEGLSVQAAAKKLSLSPVEVLRSKRRVLRRTREMLPLVEELW
ncbi:MAG: RNA polymerase sigma factor [Planctomycetes bacterium]|nr:RNA polymerase sigma factor [Planctomycetota bacterium]